MKTTTFKMIGASAVLAAAIASVSAFAHKPEQQGMGMMGEHMETMGGMMEMMSGMSADNRSKMQAACMKMMQSDGEASPSSNQDESSQ
ncbi:hypothetical protein [uncultured Marinobacter sp.]|uniref:hypothetical protein n=1 Tax=Marinobacter salarius TaxID=1420917 RepID=UPI00262B5CDC|nr:hypothetical protein [uncultured Marinobacter sp.]